MTFRKKVKLCITKDSFLGLSFFLTLAVKFSYVEGKARIPQNTMIQDRDLMWPNAVVPYMFFGSLSEYLNYIFRSYFIHMGKYDCILYYIV